MPGGRPARRADGPPAGLAIIGAWDKRGDGGQAVVDETIGPVAALRAALAITVVALRLTGSSSISVGLPQSVWLLWRSAGPRRITCPDGNAGSLMSDENQLRLGAGTGPTDLGR
jgi:hypothetical protein